jgi:hypothetical protein
LVCDTLVGEARRDRVGRRLGDGGPLLQRLDDQAFEAVAAELGVYTEQCAQFVDQGLGSSQGLARRADDAHLVDAGVLVGLAAQVAAGGACRQQEGSQIGFIGAGLEALFEVRYPDRVRHGPGH